MVVYARTKRTSWSIAKLKSPESPRYTRVRPSCLRSLSRIKPTTRHAMSIRHKAQSVFKRDAEGQQIARRNGCILHVKNWCVSFVSKVTAEWNYLTDLPDSSLEEPFRGPEERRKLSLDLLAPRCQEPRLGTASGKA
jgi:hypothetical protein